MKTKSFYLSARENEEDWKKDIITPRISCSPLVESKDKTRLLFVERKYPPLGWAFPGGMMELGETIEECSIRETKEETGVDIEIIGLVNIMSEPKYDPRWHVVIIHTLAKEIGNTEPKGGDDALNAVWLDWKEIYDDDHLWDKLTKSTQDTLTDYINWRKEGEINIR